MTASDRDHRAAAQLFVPLPLLLLTAVFAVIMVAFEVFLPYRTYSRVLKWLTLSLLAYPVTVFVVHEDWATLLRATFVPHLQLTPAFLFIITGVLGTTITAYMLFWESSQEVEEEAAAGSSGTDGGRGSGPRRSGTCASTTSAACWCPRQSPGASSSSAPRSRTPAGSRP